TGSAFPTYAMPPAPTPQVQQPLQQGLAMLHYQSSAPPSYSNPGAVPVGASLSPLWPPQRNQRDALQRPRDPKNQDSLLPTSHFLIAQSDWPHDTSDRKSILMSLHQAHV